MRIDRPTGGDSFPDRNSEGGDRPFPGAPENREPVEEPTNSRSLDDIRAAREKAGSLEEFYAIEKATRPTADSPEPRSPEPGSSAERSAALSGGGADAIEGHRQEGTPRAEGFLRPDSELPRFPGAPENREAVEEPTNSRGLDDIRAAHERATSLEEFEAIEKATRPSGYEIPAPVAGGRETFGPDVFSGWAEGARHPDAGEPSERDGDGRAGPDSRASADSSQQGRDGSEQTGSRQAQEGAGTRERPTEQPRAEITPPDKTPPDGHDGHQPPDGGDPPPPETPGHDRSGILHGHSEFHGQNLDLYTDGNRWVGGDAVRAAQAEAAKKQADGQPEPAHHGITDIPGMREQGANVIGDRPPDDESELPPDRKELLEADDRKKSLKDRLLDRLEDEEVLDDLQDKGAQHANALQELFDARPPTKSLQYHHDSPYSAPAPQHATAGDIFSAVLVTSVALAEGGRRMHDMLARRREER